MENESVAPLHLPWREPPSGLRVEKVATLSGHSERVWCARWSPVEPLLATSSGDCTVRLWGPSAVDPSVYTCVARLGGEHSRTIRHISWSPSGEYLACASFDHTATIWRRNSDEESSVEFEVEGVLDGHESELKCVEWATDAMLVTSSRDHTVWIWERVEEGDYECGGVLSGHVQDVKHCRYVLPSNEGEQPLVVSCGYDDTIKVWSEAHRQDDWQCVQTLTDHEATVWSTALQRTEPTMEEVKACHAGGGLLPQPLLCSCSDDLTVRFWKRAGGARFVHVAQCSGFAERSVYDVDWAPQGWPLVACASGDNSVVLLALHEDGEGVHCSVAARVPDAHDSDVNTVCFAASGADLEGEGLLLATGGDDTLVKLWRVRLA